MKPKPKPVPTANTTGSSKSRFYNKSRDGLGVYIADPASFPPARVIYHNDDFVAVNDMYPKSTVHTLLLPRSKDHTLLHPFDAFEDPVFLAAVQKETLNLKILVAKELQRKHGKFSRRDAEREAVLNGEKEPEGSELPTGRDWEAEVITGIHAHPSMNHLHVHVLSRDMFSQTLRHRKHYNSFNTPFLIDVANFPLAKDDPRRHPGRQEYLEQDLRCWRCGKNFGNRFKALKEHLTAEFEAWRAE